MCGSFRPGRRELADLALEDPEAVGAVQLAGALEEKLHAEADAEHRHRVAHQVVDQGIEAELADP